MSQAPLPQRADRHDNPSAHTFPAPRHVQAPHMPLDQPLVELRNRLSHILEQPFHKPPVSLGGSLRPPANAHQRRRPSIKNGQIIYPFFRAARCFGPIRMVAITLYWRSLGRLSFCVHGNTLSGKARACQVDEVVEEVVRAESPPLALPALLGEKRRRSMAHLIESER